MPPILNVIAGAGVRETLRLRDRSGNVVTSYSDDATLEGVVWAGDDQAELFDVGFTWHADGATSGKVNMEVSGADTADLLPGDYPVLLTVTGDDGPATRRIAILRVEDAPGTATALPYYATSRDMADVAGGLIGVLAESDDQAGFAEARNRAREWTDETVLTRAGRLFDEWAGGRLDVDGNWGDELDLAREATTGTGLGTKERFLAAVQSYLDDDALVLDPAVVRANAMYALGLIYGRQVTKAGGDAKASGGYQSLADDWMKQAIRRLSSATLKLDTEGDGTIILRLEPA